MASLSQNTAILGRALVSQVLPLLLFSFFKDGGRRGKGVIVGQRASCSVAPGGAAGLGLLLWKDED